jgi:hypothetical protein
MQVTDIPPFLIELNARSREKKQSHPARELSHERKMQPGDYPVAGPNGGCLIGGKRKKYSDIIHLEIVCEGLSTTSFRKRISIVCGSMNLDPREFSFPGTV